MKETYKAGAVKLMIAGLIVRIMGFLNRIFMSNLIGAEGMGLFQLASPVYSLIILTLTAGVSITVSGMTAQEKARGNEANAKRIAKTGFAFLLVVGTAVGILLVAFAKPIAVHLLHDERTYLSLIMLAPCIPIVSAASAIKGYFYGASQVTPTAVSQVVEQIVRIGVIFILASHIAGENLAYACALATVSAAVGEMANLLVVGYVFFKECRKPAVKAPTITRRSAAKTIGRFSAPISVNRFLTSIMGTVESVILPMRFLAGGLNYTASIEMLGRISGMAMPLISFPTLVTSALATTLVPAIAESMSVKNYRLANYRISRCIKMSFVMGFFCFGVFYTFGFQIGEFFYRGQEVGPLLVKLASCCILMYLQQTMAGILNGLGKQGAALVSTTIGYAIRLGFIWFVVPIYGISGFIWGTVISMVVSSGMNLIFIVQKTGMAFYLREWILKPFFPALAICVTGRFLLATELGNHTAGWIFAGGVSCLLAVLLLVMFGSVRIPRRRDLKL